MNQLMDRISFFSPVLVTCLLVSVLFRVYMKWITARIGKDRLNDIEWLKTHNVAVACKIGFPSIFISAPFVEELVFRAPLLICFPAWTNEARIWLIVSSVAFGASHWFGKVFEAVEVHGAEIGDLESNDMTKEMEKVTQEKKEKSAFCKDISIRFYDMSWFWVWISLSPVSVSLGGYCCSRPCEHDFSISYAVSLVFDRDCGIHDPKRYFGWVAVVETTKTPFFLIKQFLDSKSALADFFFSPIFLTRRSRTTCLDATYPP